MTKRSIDIEQLLRWAYREELPKRAWIDSLGLGNSFGDASVLGTRISDGMVQPYAEMIGAGIADDALKVEEAVNDLAGIRLEVTDPLVLVADMPELVEEALGALNGHTLLLHGLVARFAQLSDRPGFECERPKREIVKDTRSGAPLWFVTKKVRCRAGAERFFETREVDGYDRTAQRPMPGAYRKYQWGEPGVRAVVDLRYDYLAWALALKKLSESLVSALSKFSLEVIDRVSLPWGADAEGSARLVRPDVIVKSPRIASVAEEAGRRAAKRLQAMNEGLTAAGT